MKRKILSALLVGSLLLPAAACGGGGEESSGVAAPSEKINCEVSAAEFDAAEIDDVERYAGEVADGAVSHDGPLENGMIVSPYFTLTVGGEEVPVYATRCAKSVHSFACADILPTNGDAGFEVEVTLTAKGASKVLSVWEPSVVVLPQKRGVEAEISENTVTARISDFGIYTFTFNKAGEEAVTLCLYEAEPFEAPEGWGVQYISPEKHTMEETTFENSNTVYVFETGRHLIDSVTIPSDSWVYFEPGAYLEVYPDGEGKTRAAFCAYGGKNMRLSGRGVVDFSACMGGDAKIKGAFDFQNIDGFSADGFLSVNSNTWTLCFTDCENVRVSRCMLFGYRTYSDGIMLSDCRDSSVEGCFVRTGDDGMETKSTSAQGYTDNVVFRDNDCWTDKGNAYGVIWETNRDVKNVTFIDCSVGLAQADWTDRVGALVIQLGDHFNTVQNIRFENIEIYRCYCPAVINCELKQEGKLIDEVYIRNVHCAFATGYLLRLAEVDLRNPARFGTFYLDNVSKNGIVLTEENRNDDYMMNFIIGTSGWTPERYVFINTLS